MMGRDDQKNLRGLSKSEWVLCVNRAKRKLYRLGRKRLVPTLMAIIETGGNRDEILERIPVSTYYRKREELEEIFLKL